MTAITMLATLLLICDGAKIATCTYQNAIGVIRIAGDVPDRVKLPGMPAPMNNVQACHLKGALAAETARAAGHLPIGQVVTWQCVPSSVADTITTSTH